MLKILPQTEMNESFRSHNCKLDVFVIHCNPHMYFLRVIDHDIKNGNKSEYCC